jgi:hypothetical protein
MKEQHCTLRVPTLRLWKELRSGGVSGAGMPLAKTKKLWVLFRMGAGITESV